MSHPDDVDCRDRNGQTRCVLVHAGVLDEASRSEECALGAVRRADECGCRSGCPLVLVDDAAEDLAPGDLAASDRQLRARHRLGQLQAAVWPRLVVMTEVLDQHDFEMPAGHDEDVVQAVLPRRPHEPLGERVRPRRLNGCPQRFDADGGEHRVERGRELGVAVADEEPEPTPGPLEVGREVPGRPGLPTGRPGSW